MKKIIILKKNFLFFLLLSCAIIFSACNEEKTSTSDIVTETTISDVPTEETESNTTETETIITETTEILTNLTEDTEAFRINLQAEQSYFNSYGYNKYFNLIDINNDGVREMISSLTTPDDVWELKVWDGEVFASPACSEGEMNIFYNPQTGIVTVQEWSYPGMNYYNNYRLIEINPNAYYGADEIGTLNKWEKDGEMLFSHNGERIDEETYNKLVEELSSINVPLYAEYELTQENLDLLLPLTE